MRQAMAVEPNVPALLAPDRGISLRAGFQSGMQYGLAFELVWFACYTLANYGQQNNQISKLISHKHIIKHLMYMNISREWIKINV